MSRVQLGGVPTPARSRLHWPPSLCRVHLTLVPESARPLALDRVNDRVG